MKFSKNPRSYGFRETVVSRKPGGQFKSGWQLSTKKGEKGLDKRDDPLYNLKAVKTAAIAQSVERILGKDEVASSNLASSSKE